ncbi:fimbrial protein [Klebsiella sp. RHBSTW-00215]|nr:fimbrial protein [Klebsiella sp. RHBSTW-00215]MBA7933839.1 fimbrial protein [Klebsiella sp. RHBSTW-00215]
MSSDDGYDSMTGLNNFSGNFIASLEAIPGQTVKSGTVEAQLQIIMELQ